MSFFGSIKAFFGFGVKPKAQAPLTAVEQFKAKLAALPEGERQPFLAKAYSEAEAASAKMLASVRGQTGRAESFFTTARENFALQSFVYTQIHPQTSSVDKDYESLLGVLPRLAEVFAVPSPELLDKLDAYIQNYEEVLYLAEAGGQYKIMVSENSRWLKLPLLIEKDLKPGRKPEAEKQLAKLFASCPELSLLEMETRVPWQPISFVDIVAQNKHSRMSLLYDPEKHLYYAYRYE